MTADDVAAILAGCAAVVGAIVALIREVRLLRRDIVASVESHMAIARFQSQQHGQDEDTSSGK